MALNALASNVGLITFACASLLYLRSHSATNSRKYLQLFAFIFFTIGTLACISALVASVQGTVVTASSGLLLAVSIGILAVVAHIFFNMPAVGLFFAPLATLILLLDFFSQPSSAPYQGTDVGFAEWLKLTHIGVAIIGEAFAIGCCVVAVLYLMQQKALKQKLIDALDASTPTLHRLDRLLSWGLWLGFVGITIGLVTGAFYSQYFVDKTRGALELKILWAIAVWIWYLATLLARLVFNRSVLQVAKMCLIGFLLLATTFFGLLIFHSPGGV